MIEIGANLTLGLMFMGLIFLVSFIFWLALN